MVTDAELAPEVGESPGTLATSAALDPSQLPAAGQRFAAAFEDAYGRAPGRYAAYGYEAMALVLDVDRAAPPTPPTATAVVDAVFGLQRPRLDPRHVLDRRASATRRSARMTGYERGASGRIAAGRQDLAAVEQVARAPGSSSGKRKA